MLTEQQTEELEYLFPGKIYKNQEVIKNHSGNLFYISQYSPDVDLFAESDDDVLKAVNFCIKTKTPLIPYGSGTSVEGHTVALKGGICLDMSKMSKIKEFSPKDGYVIVEPGISYNKLNEYLEPYGYHFPVEAGWGASIGGMVSTNASGAGAVDVGSMAKNVMSCNVIAYKEGMATKITTGTKSAKSSSGYNLTSLFVGSEGTLGVITEVCLRIRKNFSHYKTVCCQFDEIDDAIAFITDLKGLVQFRKAELLDKLQTEACVFYSKVNYLYPQKNTVLIELAGNKLAIEEEARIIVDKANDKHADLLKVFADKQSAEQIWMMRKHACLASIQFIDQHKKAMATDVSVPISKLADCIKACYEHMQIMGVKAPLVSHIGDGNFHFTILINPDDPLELEQAYKFNELVVEESLKRGGTCTGEHGIGFGKKNHLKAEHGDSLFLMERLKESFDPLGIFNPGKIIDRVEEKPTVKIHQHLLSC